MKERWQLQCGPSNCSYGMAAAVRTEQLQLRCGEEASFELFYHPPEILRSFESRSSFEGAGGAGAKSAPVNLPAGGAGKSPSII